MPKAPGNNKIGVLVLVLALASLAQLLFFSYSMRQTIECQSNVNQAFLSTLQARAQIGDGDRDAIRNLVKDFTSSEGQDAFNNAVKTYEQKNKQLDALRSSFQYPEIGDCG